MEVATSGPDTTGWALGSVEGGTAHVCPQEVWSLQDPPRLIRWGVPGWVAQAAATQVQKCGATVAHQPVATNLVGQHVMEHGQGELGNGEVEVVICGVKGDVGVHKLEVNVWNPACGRSAKIVCCGGAADA